MDISLVNDVECAWSFVRRRTVVGRLRTSRLGSAVMNAYEAERDKRVARNRAMMQSLGIHTNDIVAHAKENARESRATPRSPASSSAGERAPARASRATSSAPSRRSSRLSRMSLEQVSSSSNVLEDDLVQNVRADAVADVARALHDVASRAYASRHRGKQQRATIVGTASYQHTLMRARTMSDDALLRRIRAIERAKGKHAVSKMRLFARVLFLEGKEWLAEDAADALGRLITELGDPEEAEMREICGAMALDASQARARGDDDYVGYHCDETTDLSEPSIYADVVRIEARAADENFVKEFNDRGARGEGDSITPNANIWQSAAAALANVRGSLASGNVVSVGRDGTYNVSKLVK